MIGREEIPPVPNRDSLYTNHERQQRSIPKNISARRVPFRLPNLYILSLLSSNLTVALFCLMKISGNYTTTSSITSRLLKASLNFFSVFTFTCVFTPQEILQRGIFGNRPKVLKSRQRSLQAPNGFFCVPGTQV